MLLLVICLASLIGFGSGMNQKAVTGTAFSALASGDHSDSCSVWQLCLNLSADGFVGQTDACCAATWQNGRELEKQGGGGAYTCFVLANIHWQGYIKAELALYNDTKLFNVLTYYLAFSAVPQSNSNSTDFEMDVTVSAFQVPQGTFYAATTVTNTSAAPPSSKVFVVSNATCLTY